MVFNLEKGLKGRKELIVEAKHTAAGYDSGLIEVFATPAMVGLMEGTAQESVQGSLPEGYISLGIEINVKHLKATPMGMKVCCESELVSSDGRELKFKIKAWDEDGLIGTAIHIRFIVNGKKFMDKFKENE